MPAFVRGRDTKAQTVPRPGAPRRDRPGADWVPTTCRMCLVTCQVLVRVEDGRIINVIGNPDAPRNRGRMCAKGKSGIMTHYNRSRVMTPLRRTNPEKGIGVDPRWEPITWDEALDLVAAKLRKVASEDPRRLYLQTWLDGDFERWMGGLASVVGTPYHQTGISGTCGKTIHTINYLTAGGWWDEVDFAHCRYLIDVGTQQGVTTREGFNHSVPDAATARVDGGMKLVVIDPVGNNAAAKADEWLPIRPGTDAALGLAMLHVLLNETGLYDAPYLLRHTNAPYLVRADGRYVRDADGKPLLWDTASGAAKAFDDPAAVPALDGEHPYGNATVKTALQLLKERAAQCPPEVADSITTIPAATIRRIAREFGEAARIGSIITIDGVELPYRPVALNWCRGPQGHKHAWHHTWALQLVNVVVGCINVPGGLMSRGTVVEWPHLTWPGVGQDGMVVPGGHGGHAGHHATAFPGRRASRPSRMDLFEIHPVAAHTRTLVPEVARDPARYGIADRIELLIHSAGNQIAGGWGDVGAVADWYAGIDLVVGFAIEINETHELDDIVLPMLPYVEESSFESQDAVCGEGVAFHAIQQRVVDPPAGVRDEVEVLMDIARRAGLLDDLLLVMNRVLGLRPPHLMEAGRPCSHDDALDRQARSTYGEDHGWEWFKEHGVLVWERGLEARYPGRLIKGRIPVYMENFIDRAAELAGVLGEMGIDWDLSDYDPLPKWLPCASYAQLAGGEIDAIGVHYKLPYVYGGQGNANPWVDELCERIPRSYGVLVNTRLAARLGIADGDEVWLVSPVRRAKVRASVTECVHPEVIGIAGHAGHWAGGKARTKGKGVNFNSLLPYDLEHIDTLSTSVDMCAPLRIEKA